MCLRICENEFQRLEQLNYVKKKNSLCPFSSEKPLDGDECSYHMYSRHQSNKGGNEEPGRNSYSEQSDVKLYLACK